MQAYHALTDLILVHSYTWHHLGESGWSSHRLTYLLSLPILMQSRQFDTTDISVSAMAFRSKRSSFGTAPLTFPSFTCIHITHARNAPISCNREKKRASPAPSESARLTAGNGKRKGKKDPLNPPSVHVDLCVEVTRRGSPPVSWLKRIQFNSWSLPGRDEQRERSQPGRHARTVVFLHHLTKRNVPL